MDVFEAIQNRRSVRSYMPDPVPKSKLKRILDAARLSPSAMNMQPWHFIVVSSPQKRNMLTEGRFAKFLAEAPLVIVGCGNKSRSPKWYVVDTAIAMQSMVLTATGEGLGTCWIGSFNEAHVKSLLNIPGNYGVIALLTLGYPREKSSISQRIISLASKTKKVEEIASMEEYSIAYIDPQ